jgi:hypothetical protein
LPCVRAKLENYKFVKIYKIARLHCKIVFKIVTLGAPSLKGLHLFPNWGGGGVDQCILWLSFAETKKWSDQFLVLFLHLEPGGDAVPGVEEGPPLRVLHQVVHEHADHVHGHEHQRVGAQLERNGSVFLDGKQILLRADGQGPVLKA